MSEEQRNFFSKFNLDNTLSETQASANLTAGDGNIKRGESTVSFNDGSSGIFEDNSGRYRMTSNCEKLYLQDDPGELYRRNK